MKMIHEKSKQMTTTSICSALGVPRSTLYRRQRPQPRVFKIRQIPRALSATQRLTILNILNEERFVELAPAEIFAMLLDEGRYYCSERTMYRILAEHHSVKERRKQRRHPVYAKPELIATRPNQLWSWDITKLRGPSKWTYYHLYVILDVFSRYVVGWMIAPKESALLAKKLISESCVRQMIKPDELTLHADRGSSMRSKPVALLLSDLGVTKSHSRPYVSDDNPYSESQFKTMKYRPEFPDRFGCIEDARNFCHDFFIWYNCEHRHSGINMLTPYDVHHNLAKRRISERVKILQAAYALNPERFVRGTPTHPALPEAVWINKPKTCVFAENFAGGKSCSS